MQNDRNDEKTNQITRSRNGRFKKWQKEGKKGGGSDNE